MSLSELVNSTDSRSLRSSGGGGVVQDRDHVVADLSARCIVHV